MKKNLRNEMAENSNLDLFIESWLDENMELFEQLGSRNMMLIMNTKSAIREGIKNLVKEILEILEEEKKRISRFDDGHGRHHEPD